MTKEKRLEFYREKIKALRTRIEERIVAEHECFLKNAFLFYSATDRILADEEMSLVPVPIEHSLAYIGTVGRGATLGTYLRWWRDCKEALNFVEKTWFVEKPIEPRLLCYLAGSPLSGSNGCGEVTPDGVVYRRVVSSFGDALQSFMAASWSCSHEMKERRRGDLNLRRVAEILRLDPAVMSHYEKVMRELSSKKA